MTEKRPARAPAIAATALLVVLAAAWWALSAHGPLGGDREPDRERWAVLYEKGRLVQARDELRSYLEKKPGDDRAREVLADIWWRQGRPEMALAQLRSVESLSDGGRYRTGVLALRMGEATAAVEILGGASPDQPRSFQFHYESVRALAAGGSLELAAIEWERASQYLPPAGEAILAPTRSSTTAPSRPNTFITELAGTFTTGTVQITGVATGPGTDDAVNLLIVGDDGRFWDTHDSTWSSEPVFTKSDVAPPVGEERFWRSRWDPPIADGRRLLIIAQAGDATHTTSRLPAATLITVDNRPPAIIGFGPAGGSSLVAEARATIKGEVAGAVWMRFAARVEELRAVDYIPYTTTATVDLPQKDGRRHIYGQWRDAAGNETVPGAAGSRATVFLDTTPPEIASVFPRPGATDVNSDLLLTVNFAESGLDTSSIGPGTFRLYDMEGEEVPGAVRYDRQAMTVVFSPEGALELGARYEAVLAGGVRDEFGNSLAKDQRWSFSTVGVSDHPPGAPRELTVVSGSDENKLSWAPPSAPDSGGDFEPPIRGGYNIYRGSDRRSANEPINRVPVTGTEFIDTEYGQPGLYYYQVKAVDAGGAESGGSPVRSNRPTRAVFSVRPGHDGTLTTSNSLIALTPISTTLPVELRVESRRLIGAPASPSAGVELSTDRPLHLRRLRLTVPGDPQGAVFLKAKRGGWLVLPRSLHTYDSPSRGVVYGPLAAKGTFIAVNPADTSPPGAPSPLVAEKAIESVILTWGRAADGESGIDRYRLFFSDHPIEATPTPASSADSSAALDTFDVNADSMRFTDNRAGPSRRYYAVAAVNGAGLVSRAATAAVSIADIGSAEHRPALVDAGSCRGCHLLASTAREGEVSCGLCHDGTASRVALADIKAGSKSCQSCHDLSPAQLVAADSSPRTCGGCHEAVIVTMSSTESAHANGLAAIDCQACHSLHRPEQGEMAFLVDPFNSRRVWEGDRELFCFSCHDGRAPLPSATETPGRFVARTVNRGAVAGSRSPRLEAQAWTSATHSAMTTCGDCHAPHAALTSAFSSSLGADGPCSACHGASSTPETIEVALAHGDGEGRPGCPDCHNVHVSGRSGRWTGTNEVAGPLKGVFGKTPVNGGAGTVPRLIPAEPAAYEYEICLKCHASSLATLFNPANPSYHPVEAPIRDSGLRDAALVGPWQTGATMYCSDCHRSDPETPTSGPHTSKCASLLAASFGKAAPRGREGDLCAICHESQVYVAGAEGSRFRGPGGHGDHVQGSSIACYQCHDVHGNSFTKHLIRIVAGADSSGTTAFTHDPAGGGCLSDCHREEQELYRYEHAY